MTMEREVSSEVVFTVEREKGVFGQIAVSWAVMGAHNEGEITPSSGEVR